MENKNFSIKKNNLGKNSDFQVCFWFFAKIKLMKQVKLNQVSELCAM